MWVQEPLQALALASGSSVNACAGVGRGAREGTSEPVQHQARSPVAQGCRKRFISEWVTLVEHNNI